MDSLPSRRETAPHPDRSFHVTLQLFGLHACSLPFLPSVVSHESSLVPRRWDFQHDRRFLSTQLAVFFSLVHFFTSYRPSIPKPYRSLVPRHIFFMSDYTFFCFSNFLPGMVIFLCISSGSSGVYLPIRADGGHPLVGDRLGAVGAKCRWRSSPG